MKKVIFIIGFFVAGVLLLPNVVAAQEYGDDYVGGWYDEDAAQTPNHKTGIGIQVLYGGGKNLRRDFPQTKTTWVWNDFLDFGLVGYMPLGDKRPMGILAEVGLKNLAYGNKDAVEVHVNYADLGGAFYYHGFFAGLTYGVNFGGKRIDPNEYEDELAADVFANMLDLKGGYQIQLGKKKVTSAGRFNLVGQISYALLGMSKENKVWTDPTNEYRHRKFNYQPFEVKIGFNYIFDYGKELPY